MGQTATWHLPYPEPGDPPQGAAQMQALAVATDPAITAARTHPSVPWLTTTINPISGLAWNATQHAQFTITGQGGGGLFSQPAPDQLVTARGGIYQIAGTIRTHSTTGTTAVDSWVQCYVESPAGSSALYSALTSAYGASFNDVVLSGLVRWNTGVSLAMSIYNNAGDAENVEVTKMGFLWVAD